MFSGFTVLSKQSRSFLSAILFVVVSELWFKKLLFFAEIIELSDERGQVKQMMEHIQENGTKFFRDREAVILLRVESKETRIFNKNDASSSHTNFNYEKLLENRFRTKALEELYFRKLCSTL